MKIRVMMTGRSYHQAAALPDELTLDDGATIDDALQQIQRHFTSDQSLSASCLLAVSGRHIGTVATHASQALQDGDELSLIAPVAGG